MCVPYSACVTHSHAKQMNTGLFRLPQPGQAPIMAWLSRNMLTTAEAGLPTAHREKTLALQTHDQGQSGPQELHPPFPGKEAEGERGSGRSEWEWGSGPRGAAQTSGPTGFQQGWPGTGQDQGDRPEKGHGDEVRALLWAPLSTCPCQVAQGVRPYGKGSVCSHCHQPVPGAQRWGWCKEKQTVASSHGVRARQGPWQDGIPGAARRKP